MRKILTPIVLTSLMILSACGTGEEGNSSNEEPMSYGEQMDYQITGIEPGAGVTVTTEEVLSEYSNLTGWELEQSSTAAMMAELREAIDQEEPIVVTGWNPHWMFAEYPDLKYLEDPKGVYGEAEEIRTLARIGLKEEKPGAYKILDQFEWEVEDMEGIMLEAEQTGGDIEELSRQWVHDNQDKSEAWTKGVEEVDGIEVELVTTQWDSELTSTYAVAEVMEGKGYDVTVTPADVSVMYQAVATGDADATVAVWMPTTTKEFYDEHEGDFEDLGANLEGARIGMVVPGYMDIESIEDLEPAE
ncbi:glycine betaine ABC transporter substrate-binding protein [Virgibacillus xinjiangensis]|uniref:Glycine betaine ABC transporter substrate-binding protein n=1 Tax=Virgibacillus xinjiangensis TaxID=393090 RepID=A0ABV7CW51_9BACI